MTDPVIVPSDSRARRQRDTDLSGSGWVRRFTASPPRLQEIRGLYESLGHEVLLDPLVDEELAAECRGCQLALSVFRVVYTRGGSWHPTTQNQTPPKEGNLP